MDDSTAARLNALNRDFYRRHAVSFDSRRRAPWPGWERVAERLESPGRLSILDVGCGNARFGLYLEERLGRPIDYVGLDVSPELLRIAARRAPAEWRLVEADVVADGLPPTVPGGFDLVCCFGVMHHVAGASGRRRLLGRLAAAVGPGGYLAISFWQFGDRDRFARRARPWASHGYPDGPPEPGDTLLAWGDTPDGADPGSEPPVRFCHFSDPASARRLVSTLDLEPCDEFAADGASGDLNFYLVLRATDSGADANRAG